MPEQLPFYYAEWFPYASIALGAVVAAVVFILIPFFFLMRKSVNKSIFRIERDGSGRYVIPDNLNTTFSEIKDTDGGVFLKKAPGAVRGDFAMVFINQKGKRVLCKYHLSFDENGLIKVLYPKYNFRLYQIIALDQKGRSLDGSILESVPFYKILIYGISAGVACAALTALAVLNLSTHIVGYQPSFAYMYLFAMVGLAVAPVAILGCFFLFKFLDKGGK